MSVTERETPSLSNEEAIAEVQNLPHKTFSKARQSLDSLAEKIDGDPAEVLRTMTPIIKVIGWAEALTYSLEKQAEAGRFVPFANGFPNEGPVHKR